MFCLLWHWQFLRYISLPPKKKKNRIVQSFGLFDVSSWLDSDSTISVGMSYRLCPFRHVTSEGKKCPLVVLTLVTLARCCPGLECIIVFFFLLIWSFIPVYFSVYELLVCTHEFLFSNGLWVTTQLNYFGAWIVPALVSGSPFSLALMSIWCFPHHFLFFWELFFTFWHNEMFQDHLVYTLSRPWNQPFLWGAQVPFSGKSVRHLKVHVFSDPPGCLSVGPILWKLPVAWLMNFGSS